MKLILLGAQALVGTVAKQLTQLTVPCSFR
jgi:hypothetical protein